MKARALVAAVLFALVAETAGAQPHVVVESTRVTFMGEHMPRCVGVANLINPAGQTETLSGDVLYDCIEVSGIVRFSRTALTTLRVRTVIVLPGGYFDVGNPASPLCPNGSATIILRDVPIDTSADPFQWGHGIVVFGRMTIAGCSKRAWTQFVGSMPAGAMGGTTRDTLDGWQIGDDLLPADMRQPAPTVAHPGAAALRRESPIEAMSIGSTSVGFSKGLDFEHDSVRWDSRTIEEPYVANLSRNVVIRSENPNNPGHIAFVGHAASWDLRYFELVEVGRTKNSPLDSTSGSHIGTNQIGRYALHFHHTNGQGSLVRGAVIRRTSKWGIAIHNTDDVVIEDAVCVDAPGACYVTEEGNEDRFTFRRVFSAYNAGNGKSVLENEDARFGPICPMCDGSGLWLRSVKGTVQDSVFMNARTAGIMIFPLFMPSGVTGGVPVSFRNNGTIANRVNGLEYWAQPIFPAINHTSAHNGIRQVFAGASDHNDVHLVNPTLIDSRGTTEMVATSAIYIRTLKVEGGEMRGGASGFVRGGAIHSFLVTGTVLQNKTNVELETGLAQETRFENVTHEPLGTNPKRYYVLNAQVWTGTGAFPDGIPSVWLSRQTPPLVLNHNGTGQSYRLFRMQQKASTLAWPALTGNWRDNESYYSPEQGITMGQSFAMRSHAYLGAVIQDADAITFDGLVGGVAKAGSTYDLGIPRGVLTVPNRLAPALVQNGAIRATLLAVGDPAGTDGRVQVEVDGVPPGTIHIKTQGLLFVERFLSLSGSQATPGIHTFKTWRLDTAGQKIPASLLEGSYCVPGVGIDCSGAPPPPPTPVWGTPVLGGLAPHLSITHRYRFCPSNQPESACFEVTR